MTLDDSSDPQLVWCGAVVLLLFSSELHHSATRRESVVSVWVWEQRFSGDLGAFWGEFRVFWRGDIGQERTFTTPRLLKFA